MKDKHRGNPRAVALDALLGVEEKKAFSNLELNSTLRRTALNRKDAGLATELVYGTLSRLNTIDWMIGQIIDRPLHKLEPWVRSLLRLSVYQLQYLDRIPDRAVVHEAVEEAKVRGHKGTVGFINAVLRSFIRCKNEIKIPGQWPKYKKIALQTSHPEWLVKRWLSLYGEQQTVAMCESNNVPPSVTVRVNRLKASRDEVIRSFSEEFTGVYIRPSTIVEEGLHVWNIGNAALSEAYKNGLCTIQDESSMLVGYAMNPLPGMKVLDTCAAPGGKTTHLAERMINQGRIIALDFHEHKLKLIEDNARRLGITIIEARMADARNLPDEWTRERFDRILIDAPCSGFGVIRRKPDVKWNKREADIPMMAEAQSRILEEASKCLKPGGKLVYSTCTVEPEENHKLIYRFLESHPDFSLDHTLVEDLPSAVKGYVHKSGGYVQILPHYFESDGFFISRLVRNAT